MPLYEYICTACGLRIEVLQRLGEARLSECGSCGGSLEKLISAPALQFKGTGWYVTDYARGSASKANAEAAKSEASAESKSEAKSESKSESKSETKTESKGGSETISGPAAKAS